MTIYGLLAALAWAAVAVLGILRLEAFGRRWLDRVNPKAGDPTSIEIPPDLMGFALLETEKWAQDSVLETIRERYAKLGDWKKVRVSLGAGEVPR